MMLRQRRTRRLWLGWRLGRPGMRGLETDFYRVNAHLDVERLGEAEPARNEERRAMQRKRHQNRGGESPRPPFRVRASALHRRNRPTTPPL